MESKPFSLKDRLHSFTHAFRGLWQLLKNEHNSRIHLTAAALVTVMGFYFSISPLEWVAIVLVCGLVILSELFNTAIECLSDKVEPEWDKTIGAVKDYASAAVLVASFVAVIIGAIIFFPKLASYL